MSVWRASPTPRPIQLRDALAAQVEAGRTRLILDLRGNPGGYVTAARTIASQFIGSGVIFWEQDAQGNQVATEATPGGVATDPEAQDRLPRSTAVRASASEIVAGALQDTRSGHARRRAVVRQGDRPAVAGADRRRRRVQADGRALADAGQALDPQGRADAGRRGHAPGSDPVGHRPDPRQGASRCSARRPGATSCRTPPEHESGALALAGCIGYGSPERKEVMCSDRQYA